MDDKVMVLDSLEAINGNLSKFGSMIPQTDNKELKQTLKQLRNQTEMSQEELYQLARSKNYYVPAAKATDDEVQCIKSIFTNSMS